MPATLGHIGVQYLITKGVIRQADPKWILLGCILPDLPWIGQRIALAVTDMSPLTVRLYAIGQSSLGVTLLLCLGLAQFSRESRRVLATLALSCALHLLLDATQIKWGNGVSFWGPFYWNTIRFDLFWPEEAPTLVLLGLGLGVVVWYVARIPANGSDLQWPNRQGAVIAIGALFAYVILPLTTMVAVQSKNLHFTDTIAGYEARVGHEIEIDRNPLRWVDGQPRLITWFGETMRLSGDLPEEDVRLSLIGQFKAPDDIEVLAYHTHGPHFRDRASILGLLFVLGWWMRVFLQVRRGH